MSPADALAVVSHTYAAVRRGLDNGVVAILPSWILGADRLGKPGSEVRNTVSMYRNDYVESPVLTAAVKAFNSLTSENRCFLAQ